MSHECPECGQTCYCHGDIDDCCFNLPRDQDKCIHYKICELSEEEDLGEIDELLDL
jgi:hypothetical protein